MTSEGSRVFSLVVSFRMVFRKVVVGVSGIAMIHTMIST